MHRLALLNVGIAANGCQRVTAHATPYQVVGHQSGIRRRRVKVEPEPVWMATLRGRGLAHKINHSVPCWRSLADKTALRIRTAWAGVFTISTSSPATRESSMIARSASPPV